jgi:sugar phosphate isomerase/epimerase
MKPLFSALAAVLFACTAAAAAPEFFAFDNGVGRGKPEWIPNRQAETLKALGYNGIGYNLTTPEALASWQKAMDARGMKIFSVYVYTYIGKAKGYAGDLEKSLRLLQGRDTVLWMAILRSKETEEEKAARVNAPRDARDEEAVKLIRDVCALAKKYGVKVAVYGHRGFYIETTEDAVRVVEKAGGDNLGASLNVAHEISHGNGNRMEEIIKKTASKLILVSINGADIAKQSILRLDQGDLDVTAVVKALKDNGYKGPIGLQCFSVAGDIDVNLKANIETWKKIVAKVYPE